MQNLTATIARYTRVGFAAALGLSLTLCSPTAPHAQRSREPQINVTGVSSHATDNNPGRVVTITADGPLARAQTWQDQEGFHVVTYKGRSALRGSLPKGVKMRRVGDSLELVVPVNPNASVTVEPRSNSLDLIVNDNGAAANDSGEVTESPSGIEASTRSPKAVAERQPRSADHATARAAARHRAVPGNTNPASDALAGAASTTTDKVEVIKALPTSEATPSKSVSLPDAPLTKQANSAASTASGTTPNPALAGSATPQTTATPPLSLVTLPKAVDGEETTGSGTMLWVLISVVIILGGLVIIWRRRRAASGDSEQGRKRKATERPKTEGVRLTFKQKPSERPAENQTASVPRNPTSAPHNGKPERRSEGRAKPTASGALPAVEFGAFQVGLECDKLVHGKPHRIEVLASRAIEDRRAIETSLMKTLYAPVAMDEQRRRARVALEEYGFVARQSAALLLASDVCERTAAAHALGQIKSPSSLPFLLEALYDAETVVRTEAVASLGALGLPAAIGALLDVARRYPEMPATLISEALSKCSVDCLNFSSASFADDRPLLASASGALFTGEITGLEPALEVDQLPVWLEDETLAEAMERLESQDPEARVAAAQSLAQFQVQRSVEALSAMATCDMEAAVRAAAVTSLGHINHESVFGPVLMSMADESREVRAAAARALSRLSFDRADAYVRVIETSDQKTLGDIARACTTAGLAAQALQRLTSEDRRQAYEAFSLLSLVVRGGETQLMFDAVERHHDTNVRLAVVRLLGLMGRPDIITRLSQLAQQSAVPEDVRSAILEAVYRAERLPTEIA